MNHATAVEAFLTDVVNLNTARLAQLETRVASIVSALCADGVIGPMFVTHIPQGSWAHETIIRPVGALDEFDADFLLQLTPDDVWNLEKRRYLRELRAAFKRHSKYASMVQKKNRCCRIDYANDCHVDVVPYLVLPDGRQVIVNYAENDFEDTNPAGFTAWMKEKDELAGRNLRKVIRLVKYLRDHKNTFDCPSVILTMLLGGAVQAYDATDRYADVANAFVNLLTDLEEWLDRHPMMPFLEDPSCPGTSFNHRWSEAKYQTFKTCISRYAAWARAAIGETDDDLAVAAWQELFGENFKKPSAVAVVLSAVTKAAKPLLPVKRAPREQFIEEQGLVLTGGYTARIDGRVAAQKGFRDGDIRTLGAVPKHRTLRFRVTTDAPAPYRVLWKVRNRGDEAERVGGLRGELIPDDGTMRRTESTLYSGRHYVEVYVVKGNEVVATDHHEVRIA
jgi:hypothetical protein